MLLALRGTVVGCAVILVCVGAAVSCFTSLAFVVPGGEHCTPISVRNYLTARLPGYLIPSAIYLCESLPLSSSGKVDQRALLAIHDSAGDLVP